MCKREKPKSTSEELQKFYSELLTVIAKAPEDAVLTVLAMNNPHSHPAGPLVISIKGSGCSLINLMRGAISNAPDFKEVFYRTQKSVKECPVDISRAAEDIANGD